jgi:hypothetical protein
MRTGSLQNLLADRSTDAAIPEIGMGVTLIRWTDRQAGTIIEASKSLHRIVVQLDTATRTDSNGMSEAQTYTFERNPNGRTEVYTRRKDGSYRESGGTSRCVLGVRAAYHDYSF